MAVILQGLKTYLTLPVIYLVMLLLSVDDYLLMHWVRD
jgi:hypothetical protein